MKLEAGCHRFRYLHRTVPPFLGSFAFDVNIEHCVFDEFVCFAVYFSYPG